MPKKGAAAFLSVLLFSLSPALLSAQTEAQRLTQEATLSFRAKNYQQAIRQSQQAAALIDKKNVSLIMDNYANWSASLIALERYGEAIEIANAAQNISPFDPRTIQTLGEAYYHIGDGARALPFLQQYIAINPTGDYVGRIYYYMGEIYLRQGFYNHADIAFSTAVYHSPLTVRWWYRLGYTREMGGDLLGAKTAYDEALKLNPSFAEAKRRQAALLNSLR
jgi:tetratricopeptide (TPR) repeat protein